MILEDHENLPPKHHSNAPTWDLLARQESLLIQPTDTVSSGFAITYRIGSRDGGLTAVYMSQHHLVGQSQDLSRQSNRERRIIPFPRGIVHKDVHLGGYAS